MISLIDAIGFVKELNPELVIQSAMEDANTYLFFATPKGSGIDWMDGWICIDKTTGIEKIGKAFSCPKDFLGYRPVDI